MDGTSLTKDFTAFFPNFLGGALLSADTSADIQGSIRGKIGVAWDRFMIYGTGGVAFGGFNTDLELAVLTRRFVTPFFASDNFSTTRTGWTAGGGAQYAVTNNCSHLTIRGGLRTDRPTFQIFGKTALHWA